MAVLDKYGLNVTRAGFLLDKPSGVSTTSTAPAAADQATLIVVGTTILAGMDVGIGSGETYEIGRVLTGGATTVVLTKPLQFAHASGDAVVEQADLMLGNPEAEGIKINVNAETTDVFDCISRFPFGTLSGFTDLGGSLRMPTPTTDILAMALGLARSEVIGDGTTAAQTGLVGPRMFTTNGVNFGVLTRATLYVSVQKVDGTYMTWYAQNLSFDPTALSVQYARNTVANVPMKFLFSSMRTDFTNAAFVPASSVATYLASKGDLVSEITAVGNLTSSGTSTTSTGVTAAGAYTIAVTSATGITAGLWIGIGVGALKEWHQVDSVVSLSVKLRTKILNGFAASTPVVVQTNTPFAGISIGGVTMSTSGQVSTLRAETFRASLGYRVGNAAIQFTMNLSALTPENFLAAYGLPIAEYANTVLPFRAIGSGTPLTLVLTALTQSGKTITICLWDGSAVIASETTLSAAVETQLSMTYKPRMMQYLYN